MSGHLRLLGEKDRALRYHFSAMSRKEEYLPQVAVVVNLYLSRSFTGVEYSGERKGQLVRANHQLEERAM